MLRITVNKYFQGPTHYPVIFLLLSIYIAKVSAINPRFDPFLPQTQFFDLGYEFVEGETIFYPGQRFDYELFEDQKGYNFTKPDNQKFWFATFSFCMAEHGGTHVDAPYHFNEFGYKLGEIPPSRMVDVKAVIVDVEKDCFSSPNPQDFTVELKYFLEHERMVGPIPFGAVVLVRTGWDRFWPNKDAYLGRRNDGTLNYPGISEAAAAWLTNERKVVAVGIDTPSMDVGIANFKGRLPAHLILCGNNVYLIENVANLGTLLQHIRPNRDLNNMPLPAHPRPYLLDAQRECDLRLIVLPIKSRGTGGPARVIAYCKN